MPRAALWGINSKRTRCTCIYHGIILPQKRIKTQEKEHNQSSFTFRVKIGESEIEVTGKYGDVMATLENLPSLLVNLQKAFEDAKPKTVATLTVKTESPPKETSSTAKQTYPKIVRVANCQEAVIRVLETDWGKWRPRTMEEIKEVMNANDLKHSGRVLSDTLNKLADKGLVRRWNTNTGFVYILAEEKTLSSGGESR
jgi:hypothetical protein